MIKTNSKAKFYIYRNLNCGKKFSIKFKGKVIYRLDDFEAYNCTLRVSEAGRQRAIQRKKRNVHAFVCCDQFSLTSKSEVNPQNHLYYNPFKTNSFTCQDRNVDKADKVIFKDGKAYIA